MIISTTESIDRYQITEYLAIVTGADTYTVGGLIGEGFMRQGSLFKQAVAKIRQEMERVAVSLGADAIVGFNISSTSMATSGSIVVTGIGTAVKLKQNGWDDELPDL